MPLFLEMLRSETAASPDGMGTALTGLRRYQGAPRAAIEPPRPVRAAAGRAVLRDHGGSGPAAIFVPSLINPPTVLDLDRDNSLLRYLAEQGVRPLLVDWGTPAADEADMDVAGHVERLLLPLIDAVGEPVSLVGYCLGGTMAIAAAAARPVRDLALIATPWHFSGFPPMARAQLAELWMQVEPTARALRVLPMEFLQPAFWRLDPARTVGKFEALGRHVPDPAALARFVALEDWSNDGAPLTLGAARQMFEDLFRDDLTGRGQWTVAGRTVDPAALTCPVLDIRSSTDRIVPAATAARVGTELALDLGHVGMVVGHRAPDQLWRPLRNWLRRPA